MVIKGTVFGFMIKCGKLNTCIYICSLKKKLIEIKVKEYKRENGGPQLSTRFQKRASGWKGWQR